MNSKGPKHEPWGTPQFKSKGRERTPCTETRWLLSDKYDLNQFRAVPRMPTSSDSLSLAHLSHFHLKMEKLYGWYESAVALRPLVSRGIGWTRASVKPKPLPIFYMLWSTSGIRSKNRNRETAKYILEWIIVMWRKGVYHLTEKSVWGVQSKLKNTRISTFFLCELNTKKRRICEVEVWNQYNWSMG